MTQSNHGFATELATRLSNHQEFWRIFGNLAGSGAVSTLPVGFERTGSSPTPEDLSKLLYCAGVFSQTESDEFRGLAQSIAFNCLLSDTDGKSYESSIRVLSELGNFPGLQQAEDQLAARELSLLGLLNRRISQQLNTVTFADHSIALTDYQKSVWDSLPNSKAISISAPTSAGKSFLVIEHACRLIEATPEFSCVYIAPTRALLGEVHQKFKQRLASSEGVRVTSVPALDSEKHPRQVYVLTQERLQALLAISTIAFDLVIVDEAQNLSDGARGMILQDCLEQSLQRNGETQTVFLSPGATGFKEAASAIGVGGLLSSQSKLSPVLQNRIVVQPFPGSNRLQLSLLTSRGELPIGFHTASREFDNPKTRLASVALELGSTGGSLVYATGPSDAEKVALQIAQGREATDSPGLSALADFIRVHIHPEYKLADYCLKGVGFHYGKMPTLLREALEGAFRDGDLDFLACTTTLFQGVNLPARNVFIDTPTRGAGATLDPALLWNFAGRAGRMKSDIVGNVFLVDYERWPERIMDGFVGFKIEPALRTTLESSFEQVLDAVAGKMPARQLRDEAPAKIRAAAGLLISRAAKGDVDSFVSRVLPGARQDRRSSLAKAATISAKSIDLPSDLLAANWTIDPFGQRRLYERIVEKIVNNDVETLFPINPNSENSGTIYAAIFNRILKAVYGNSGKFGGYVSTLAIPWMQGMPYPKILSRAIARERQRREKDVAEWEANPFGPSGRRRPRPRPVDPSQVIRGVFDTIEDVVRFQFVQLGRAYIDLLSLALRRTDRAHLVPSIFDFSLALELGVSTKSGRAFVELGLSRIAASALENLYPDSALTPTKARAWLQKTNISTLKLSPVIEDEIHRLGLAIGN